VKLIKNISLFALIGIIICLFVSTASATTWETYREDISISSATVDIDIESLNVSGNTMSSNVTLPCKLSELDGSQTKMTINATENCTFNLTVNGVAVNSSTHLNSTAGYWANITLTVSIAAGVDQNDAYLNVTVEANNSEIITAKGYIVGNDASCTSSFVTDSQTVKEKDTSTPFIGVSASDSYWSVNNSVEFSHSLGYTITDINCTLSYASQAITEPDSYLNFGSIATGNSKTSYVNYQKYGPYVYDADNNVNEGTHVVDVYIKSPELLTNAVDWNLNPEDDVYDGAFDTLNYDTLDVELNGADKDWDQGSIEMDELTITDQYSQNKFTFTWTEAGIVEEMPEKEFIIPMWMVVLSVAAIVVIVVAYFYYKTE